MSIQSFNTLLIQIGHQLTHKITKDMQVVLGEVKTIEWLGVLSFLLITNSLLNSTLQCSLTIT